MYFDETIQIRIRSDRLKLIDQIVEIDNKDRYKDRSEWVRAAIERLLRLDKERYDLEVA